MNPEMVCEFGRFFHKSRGLVVASLFARLCASVTHVIDIVIWYADGAFLTLGWWSCVLIVLAWDGGPTSDVGMVVPASTAFSWW